MLKTIDQLWQEHLLSIDHLRSDVGLRAVGQKDPLLEFKHEAFRLFDELSQRIQMNISKDLFRFELVPPQEQRMQDSLRSLQMHTQKNFVPQPDEEPQEEPTYNLQKAPPKIGRNDDCPCGSGKKYKKCCGAALSTLE
jgi:preprotein translocase subunit SecA